MLWSAVLRGKETRRCCPPRAFHFPTCSLVFPATKLEFPIKFYTNQCKYCFFLFLSSIFCGVWIKALLCNVSLAFTPSTTKTSSVRYTQQPKLPALQAATNYADEVDVIGNNIKVKELLEKVENDRLLSKVAASGLLSKAQAAGITLSKLEPLLELAASNPEILILVEASGPELLPILPTIVDVAPGALPLLATAITVPPPLIGAAGLAVIGAAFTACSVIPDDSVTNVALQTFIVALSLPAVVASFAGAAILGQLK